MEHQAKRVGLLRCRGRGPSQQGHAPDGYAVAPPQLPADAPVPYVLQPAVVHALEALRQDADGAACHRLVRRTESAYPPYVVVTNALHAYQLHGHNFRPQHIGRLLAQDNIHLNTSPGKVVRNAAASGAITLQALVDTQHAYRTA